MFFYYKNVPTSFENPNISRTKCTFHKFGPSGTVEKFDGLCVLPLNIINEKIYVFLWFWFIILSIVSVIQVLYRMVTLFALPMREMLLRSRCRLVKDKYVVEGVCRRIGIGDWFLLYQLGKSIDPLIYKEFVESLFSNLEKNQLIS